MAAEPDSSTEQPTEEPRRWSHLFSRHSGLDDLQQPIKASARIRYNCLSVSQRYIGLGTNTGVVYVFSKETLKYGHLITSEKEGAIIQVAFSPDDNILAYATSYGFVFVVRMRMDQRAKPDKLRSTSDHRTATITAMRWSPSGGQVFVGDNMGKVSVINVSNKARDILKASSEVIMRLDSPIIQIDAFDDRVLVSTTTKTYISNTSKHVFHSIGSKSRDGYYGACFYHSKVNTTPVIYCGRPGSRMWEVDYEEARVINTHQFKKLLNVPSLPLVDTNADDATYPDVPTEAPGPQSINFQQLLLINEQFLLTWNNRGVYVFDPTKVSVVLWISEVKDIHSLQLHKNEVYVLHRDHTLERFDLFNIPKIVAKLFNSSKLRLASQLSVAYSTTITLASSRKHVPKSLVLHLINHARRRGRDELAQNLETVLNCLDMPPTSKVEEASLSCHDGTAFERLDSGIYVIRQRSDSTPYVGDMSRDKASGEPSSDAPDAPGACDGGKVGIGLPVISDAGDEQAASVETTQDAETEGWKSEGPLLNHLKISHGQQIQGYYEPTDPVAVPVPPQVKPRRDSQHASSHSPRVPPGFSPMDRNNQWQASMVLSHDHYNQLQDSLDTLTNQVVHSEVHGDHPGMDEESAAAATPLTEALGYIPEIQISVDDVPADSIVSATSLPEINPSFSVYFKKSSEDISAVMRSVVSSDHPSTFHPGSSTRAVSIPPPEEEKSSQKSYSPGSQSAETDSGIVERCMSQESLTASEVSMETVSLHSRRGSSASASSSEMHGAVSANIFSTKRSQRKGKKLKSLTVDLEPAQPGKTHVSPKSSKTLLKHRTPRIVTMMKDSGLGAPKCVRKRNDSETSAQMSLGVGMNHATPDVDGTNGDKGPRKHGSHRINSEDDQSMQDDKDITFGVYPAAIEADDKRVDRKRDLSVNESDLVSHCDIIEIKNPFSRDLSRGNDEKQINGALPGIDQNDKVQNSLNKGPDIPAISDMDSIDKTATETDGEKPQESASSTMQEDGSGRVNGMPTIEASQGHGVAPDSGVEESYPNGLLEPGETQAEHCVQKEPADGKNGQGQVRNMSCSEHDGVKSSLDPTGVVSSGLENSMESSSEFDKSDETHSSTSASEDSNSVKNKFFSVKDRLSAKVSATTQSLLQTLKDKKNQLNRKDLIDDQATELPEEKVKYPAIDLSDFEAVTQCTKKTLQDYSVMYNTTLTKAALNSWCVSLHETLKRLHHEITLLEQETAPESQGQTDLGQGQTDLGQGQTDLGQGQTAQGQCQTDLGQGQIDLGQGQTDENLTDHIDKKSNDDLQEGTTEPRAVLSQTSLTGSEVDLDLHSCPKDKATQEAEKNAQLLQTFVANDLELSVEIEDVQQRRDSSFGKIMNIDLTEEMEGQKQDAEDKSDVQVDKCDPESTHRANRNDAPLKLQRDVMYIEDPFYLSSALQEDASHLAHLAVQFECHGDIDVHFETATVPDCDRKNSKACDHAHQSNIRHRNGHHSRLQMGDVIDGDSDFSRRQDSTTCLECLRDQCLALFIQLYFHLLSGKVTSLQKALLSKPSCRQSSWKALVKCIQAYTSEDFVCQLLANEEIDGSFDLLRSNIGHDGALCLGFLHSLYQVVPKKTLQFLAQDCWRSVAPVEVLWLCDGPKRGSHFEFYIHRCLHGISGNRRRECIKNLCKCQEVQTAWWELLLNQGTTAKEKRCHCGMPWPGSHRGLWKQETLMSELLDLGCCDDEVLHLCYQQGYWRGVLHQLSQSRAQADWWRIALQLGDADLINQYSDFLPKTQKEWTAVLTLKEKQAYICLPPVDAMPMPMPVPVPAPLPKQPPSVHCLKCGKDFNPPAPQTLEFEDRILDQVPEITWEDLGRRLVASMGTEVALDLLNAVAIPRNVLSLQFYDSCIRATRMDQNQRALVHMMLEKLDTYLWSNRTASLPPQVVLAVSRERSSRSQQNAGDQALPDRLFSKLDDLDLPVVTLEDPDVHWGIQTNIASLCQCCAVPLNEVVSRINSGIHLFQCGHGYHRNCIPERTCLVCIGRGCRDQPQDSATGLHC